MPSSESWVWAAATTSSPSGDAPMAFSMRWIIICVIASSLPSTGGISSGKSIRKARFRSRREALVCITASSMQCNKSTDVVVRLSVPDSSAVTWIKSLIKVPILSMPERTLSRNFLCMAPSNPTDSLSRRSV